MAGKGIAYTQEFKDSAIQMALNSEKSVLKIADDIGVHNKTLYGWLNKYKKANNLEGIKSVSGSKTKEILEEENRRLRRELVSVKKDREILKKAAAYFAKEAL